VPILVLAFVVMVLVFPTLGPGETVKFGGLQLLVLFTLVGMLAGAYVIWDLGRIFRPHGRGDGQRDGDIGASSAGATRSARSCRPSTRCC